MRRALRDGIPLLATASQAKQRSRSVACLFPALPFAAGADGVPIDTPPRFVSLSVLAAGTAPRQSLFVTDP
jgi:hypothetical protein